MTRPLLIFILILSGCNFRSSEYYNSKAEKLEEKGMYQEAIKFLDKAIEKDPRNIYALLNRAVDKSILGDYKGAIEDYSSVIQIDESNKLAYLNRGKNKARLENYAGAVDDFNKTVSLKGMIEQSYNPGFPTDFEFDVKWEEVLYERGISRYYLDSLELAFEDFSFCIMEGYQLSSSHFLRGLIYISSGRKREGCADLARAHQLGDPDALVRFSQHCN